MASVFVANDVINFNIVLFVSLDWKTVFCRGKRSEYSESTILLSKLTRRQNNTFNVKIVAFRD